jgi:hypothetical protein
MTKRYRIALELNLDESREATVVESARKMFRKQAGETRPPGAGAPDIASAEEVIDGPLSALMEIVQDNPLFEKLGIDIQRLIGDEEKGGELSKDAEEFQDGSEQAEEEISDLDEFETGAYLCRWPNGEFSVVQAGSRRDALVQLDEWAPADASWLVPMDSCMIDFALNDRGEIELAQFSEDTDDFVWERCYPELREVLSSESDERTIREAVEHERKRLWGAQPPGPEAETEIGKQLQKQMRMAGPVADFHVKHMADRILKSKRGKGGKPN